MSRVHEFRNLDDEKKINVVRSFRWSEIMGTIIYVIDDTMFGSCKDGCVITSHYFISRAAFSDPEIIELSEIREISCDEKTLRVNGRKIFQFHMPDEQEIQNFFQYINGELQNIDETIDENEEEAENLTVNVDGILNRLELNLTQLKTAQPSDETCQEIVSLNFLIKLIDAAISFERRVFVEGQSNSYLNIAQGHPRARLASYTYASAFITAALRKEAQFSLDAAERYYQFPFFLISHLISESSNAPSRSIGSVIDKNSGSKGSDDFKICDNRFGYFVKTLEKEGSCSKSYLFMLRDILIKQLTPVQYSVFSKALDNDGCARYIDDELQVFESEINDSLIDILEIFSRTNEYPRLFENIGKPIKLFFGIDENSIEPRVFIDN